MDCFVTYFATCFQLCALYLAECHCDSDSEKNYENIDLCFEIRYKESQTKRYLTQDSHYEQRL